MNLSQFKIQNSPLICSTTKELHLLVKLLLSVFDTLRETSFNINKKQDGIALSISDEDYLQINKFLHCLPDNVQLEQDLNYDGIEEAINEFKKTKVQSLKNSISLSLHELLSTKEAVQFFKEVFKIQNSFRFITTANVEYGAMPAEDSIILSFASEQEIIDFLGNHFKQKYYFSHSPTESSENKTTYFGFMLKFEELKNLKLEWPNSIITKKLKAFSIINLSQANEKWIVQALKTNQEINLAKLMREIYLHAKQLNLQDFLDLWFAVLMSKRIDPVEFIKRINGLRELKYFLGNPEHFYQPLKFIKPVDEITWKIYLDLNKEDLTLEHLQMFIYEISSFEYLQQIINYLDKKGRLNNINLSELDLTNIPAGSRWFMLRNYLLDIYKNKNIDEWIAVLKQMPESISDSEFLREWFQDNMIINMDDVISKALNQEIFELVKFANRGELIKIFYASRKHRYGFFEECTSWSAKIILKYVNQRYLDPMLDENHDLLIILIYLYFIEIPNCNKSDKLMLKLIKKSYGYIRLVDVSQLTETFILNAIKMSPFVFEEIQKNEVLDKKYKELNISDEKVSKNSIISKYLFNLSQVLCHDGDESSYFSRLGVDKLLPIWLEWGLNNDLEAEYKYIDKFIQFLKTELIDNEVYKQITVDSKLCMRQMHRTILQGPALLEESKNSNKIDENHISYRK